MVTQSLCPMVSPLAAVRSPTDSKVRMVNIVPDLGSVAARRWSSAGMRTTAIRAALAWTTCMATCTTTIGVAAPASADVPCDPGALTVSAAGVQPGLGHRGIQLDLALQTGSCQLTGYPAVD